MHNQLDELRAENRRKNNQLDESRAREDNLRESNDVLQQCIGRFEERLRNFRNQEQLQDDLLQVVSLVLLTNYWS